PQRGYYTLAASPTRRSPSQSTSVQRNVRRLLCLTPILAVEECVDVGTLGEAAAVGVEPARLGAGPGLVRLVLALEDPVDMQIGAGLDGARDRAVLREAQVLEVARGDPAPAGEEPGSDHRAAVEVVAPIPAVVRDLVPPMRLDRREEHAADDDRLS